MVDLIYGRGITDLIREMPFYINIFTKYASIKLFHARPTMSGSADIINVCNLHCTHCYWWLNRKNNNNELSASQWRKIIRNTFKKLKRDSRKIVEQTSFYNNSHGIKGIKLYGESAIAVCVNLLVTTGLDYMIH